MSLLFDLGKYLVYIRWYNWSLSGSCLRYIFALCPAWVIMYEMFSVTAREREGRWEHGQKGL